LQKLSGGDAADLLVEFDDSQSGTLGTALNAPICEIACGFPPWGSDIG
jgi:hypothetical protein